MKVAEYYYNPVSKNYLTVPQSKYDSKHTVNINENWHNQKVGYKNRLVSNPIYMGSGGAGGPGGPGDNYAYGSGVFTGKSKAEKMKMCGITGDYMSGAEVEDGGLLTSVNLPDSHGGKTLKVNKAAAADLQAICKEICALGFFDMLISNTFRRNNSVSRGVSKHCWGVAIDINPCRGCPWFATHIDRSFTEPSAGTSPPWPFKKYSCGSYNRATCIWSYDHPVVKVFEAHGWGWGGKYGDTMHFSLMDGH